MNAEHRADRLGTEPLGRLIVRFSIPVIAQLVVNALYNLVDRVFVGRGVGPAALAGITISLPFFILVSAVGTLFGHGAATAISLRLGRKDRAGAGAFASVALAGSVAAAVLTAGVAFLLLRPCWSCSAAAARCWQRRSGSRPSRWWGRCSRSWPYPWAW